LHFARNDYAFAQDLVQETFLRILSARKTLTDLDNIEPLLYTHLRYAYLTERRRGRDCSFQPLAVAHLEALPVGLPPSSDLDQLEIQNELRWVLAYLSWRRRTAKFASIFLLRFFHGFMPEEIAVICLVTRRAVDLGLLRTREELRGTQANHADLPALRRGSPHLILSNIAFSSENFASELLATLFNSVYDTCPEDTEWERRYGGTHQRPLNADTLAHLVSCKPCLDRVTELCGAPPPDIRSIEEALRRLRGSEKSSCASAAGLRNRGAISAPRK